MLAMFFSSAEVLIEIIARSLAGERWCETVLLALSGAIVKFTGGIWEAGTPVHGAENV